jgi:hypothetical protein
MKSKKKDSGKTLTIDLPEVKDIPGQEHIKPPRIGEMADSTPSSAGEEGEGLLDNINKNEEEIMTGDENVSEEERILLERSDRPVTEETADLEKLALDATDEEDLLNEAGDPLDMGKDLDIPGSELDDENEAIGEEDEENNAYSQRD